MAYGIDGNISVDDLISRLSTSHDEIKTAAATHATQEKQVVSLAERKEAATAAFTALTDGGNSITEKTAAYHAESATSHNLQYLRKQAAELEQAESLVDIQSGALIGTAAAQAFLGEMDKYANVAQYVQGRTKVAQYEAPQSAEEVAYLAAARGREDATELLAKEASQRGREDAVETLVKQAAVKGVEDALGEVVKLAAQAGIEDAHNSLVTMHNQANALEKLARVCVYAYNDTFDYMNELLA